MSRAGPDTSPPAGVRPLQFETWLFVQPPPKAQGQTLAGWSVAYAEEIQAHVSASPSSSRVLGLPAELALCQRRIEHAALQLAGTRARRTPVSRSTPATRWIRSYSSTTDVSTPMPTLSTPPACSAAATVAATTSPHVHVVACLRPVPEDPRRPTIAQQLHEDRHDTRFALRILPRPVDVPVTQRHVRSVVQPVVRSDVLLARELEAPYGGSGARGWSSRAGASHSP